MIIIAGNKSFVLTLEWLFYWTLLLLGKTDIWLQCFFLFETSDASSIVYQPIYDVWSIEGGIQHTVTVYLSLVSNLLNLTWESMARCNILSSAE